MSDKIESDPDNAVRELREHLYHHLADCIDHRVAEPQIGRGSPWHRIFARALTASSLAGSPARWTLEAPLDLPRVLALHALELVQTMPRERLHRCHAEGCGWLFPDSPRNHSRRGCGCGNSDRARRHYARSRGRH